MQEQVISVNMQVKFFENMSMEGRMTVCNMSIEMGARGGMIADETTFNYVKRRQFHQKVKNGKKN